jgi:6-phosphofructokinase
MSAKNLMIVQGGGPTAVFNASLASILREAREQPCIGKIFGARCGMKGLSQGNILDLSGLTPDDLSQVANSPGAALGSSRFKPGDEDFERCVANLRRMEIRYLVFMGGNGTMRGAEIVRAFCRSTHFEVEIVGVPKTIDNDITATDRCPGFASAARYVAQSTLDLAMDIRSLPQPVSIFETLGRDVGWLAASASLAKRDPDDAPHLVYVPEIPFSREAFLAELENVVSRLGWAVVIVSEGIRYADGTPVFEQQMPDKGKVLNRPLIGGVAQYLSGVVAENLGVRCRSEKPGLIGRSAMAYVSAQDRADAELVGREAVRALVSGRSDHMVALRSLDSSGAAPFSLVALQQVSGSQRALPNPWLQEGAIPVTEQFRDYVRPLIGDLSYYSRVFHDRGL